MVLDELRPTVSVTADITGSGGMLGGGSSKSGSSSTKSDAANTLRSNARARIVEMLGEGEIVGLVNGAKSIYFDSTPLQNAEGSYNFTGVTWFERHGLPDQAHITGFPMTETPFQVNVEIKKSQEPPVRTIADRNATAVRVIMNMPSIVTQDPKTGSLLPTSVDYVIQLRKYGQTTWVDQQRGLFLQQKTTSPYQKSHKVDLPEDGYPWDIRVVRVNPDAPNEYVQCSSIWEGYTVLVEGKFTYPNTALVALELDAENFGSSIPARYYDVKGLIVQVPSNYDPETRTYNGFWDGTFKRAWTNNPAWVLYDLLTANRYGLGEFIDASKIDKWGLYEIAQYCDQSVPDGYGLREPRFTYNCVINSRDEAFKVLQNITTAFRGMAFWSLGQVFAVADMPRDYDKIFSPANVIGGTFNYSGTAKKARHSVAMVSWNDPNDFYRTAIEVVQHDDALDRFGWRQTDVQAVGCTSRGQAYRYGKWILDTEHSATETVEFECDLETLAHDPIRPGHVIAVADPRKAQVRLGGRIRSAAGPRLTLDKAFEPAAGESYRISVTMPSGVLFTADIVGWADANAVAILNQAPPEAIQPFATWAITGTDIAPRQYRVLVAREEKKNTFKITALFHDPTKYARVEEEIILEPIRYTRPKTTVKPVTNIKGTESLYQKDGGFRSRISLSWTPGDDFMSARYSINASTPEGDVSYGTVASTTYDIDDITEGTYTFSITAIGINGKLSTPETYVFQAKGWTGAAGPEIVDLQVKGGGGEFQGQDATLEWGVAWPTGSQPYDLDFVVRVFDIETRAVLSEWVAPTQTFTYTFAENLADGGPRRKFWVQVRARDMNGREGAAATLVVNNPAPDLIIPDIQTTTESIFVAYDRPTDPDFRGGLVWQSLEQGFDPLTTKPAYDGSNTLINLKAAKNTSYYVRFAAYDAFGQTGLNISPEQRVYVLDRIIDTVPPEIPTGLKLSTGTEVTSDGTLQAFIKGDWDAPIATNFKTFQVELAEGSGAFLRDGGTELPAFTKHGLKPAQRYRVRVRGLNGSAYESAWSDEAEIVTAKNETPPGPVQGFSGEAAFQSGNLSWTNPTDRDLAFIEIWTGTKADASDRVLLQRVGAPTNFFFDKTLVMAEPRFYWARTVNTSDVYSPGFVGPIKLTSPQLQKAEIANGILDQTKFASGLSLIGLNDGLPEVAGYVGPSIITNTKDGKLYRLIDGKWTLVVAEVRIEDIVGQITADMIAEIEAAKISGTLTSDQIEGLATNKLIGKIVSDQIAALGVDKLVGQLKASQLEAIESAKLIGQVVDSQIAALGVGKLTGQIVNTQIADGSISTPKMLAGSIAADRLVAESITSAQIKARTIVATDIAVGTLTGDELAANTITGDKIKANTLLASSIVAGSITTLQIQAGGVNADRLVANSITAGQLAANSVTAVAISAGSISANHIVAYSLTAGHIAARSLLAENIAVGTLTGAEIKAGSVSADRLVANSITAGQIQAGAIRAEAIAAGAIVADTIGVGLTTGNLFFNSGFEASNAGFITTGYTDGVAPETGWRTDWAPQGMGSAMVHRSGSPGNRNYVDSVLHRRTQSGWESSYPVTPGQRYEFTSYVSVHRALAQVILLFVDGNGAGINAPSSGDQGTYLSNGPLENWARVTTFGTAPAGATRVIPIARTIWTGESDPYVFWTGLYFGRALANQSQFSIYAPQSSTVIDGGIVATNSLHAEKIIAGTVSADKIAARTLTADKIAAGTLTGNEIAANSIYADRIQIGGGQPLTTWLGGPNNTQINGGAVAANTIAANKLTIGARGLSISGLRFYTTKESNTVNWDGGSIGWVNDSGVIEGTPIAGGSYAYGAYLYIYWTKGQGNLNVTADFGTSFAGDNVLIATYDGYAGLNAIYGASLIDGTQIRTGTITAGQIAAGQIQASHIAAGQITAGHIGAGQVTADKINGGVINVSDALYLGSTRFQLDSGSRMMRIFTPQGTEAVSIGNIGRFSGQSDEGAHGIIIRGPGNSEVLRADGSGAYIEAAYIRNLVVQNAQIANGAIDSAKIGYAAIQGAHIGELVVDTARIANGAVSQALGAENSGHYTLLSVSVRTNEAKLKISGIVQNNPNENKGFGSAGIVQIYWNPNNDGNRRVLIKQCAANMWIDKNGSNYHGTTPVSVIHQPGAGLHSYNIEVNTGAGDSSMIDIIELTK